jgi:hypothetical protein
MYACFKQKGCVTLFVMQIINEFKTFLSLYFFLQINTIHAYLRNNLWKG